MKHEDWQKLPTKYGLKAKTSRLTPTETQWYSARNRFKSWLEKRNQLEYEPGDSLNSDNSASTVTELWTGQPKFDSRQRQGYFSLRHRVQTGSGAHPASYEIGNLGPFSEGKAARR
jgi:hypothetical protein